MTSQQVREDGIRLSATYLNTMAAGFAVGGFVTIPLALITKSASSDVPERTPFLIALIIISIVVSAALHVGARALLRRLG